MGNGGSAAHAAHFAAELSGRFNRERKPIAAIALGQNAAEMTALANDFGYEQSFGRMINALMQPGDMVIALTTSGRSKNIISALRMAGRRGAYRAAWTGPSGIQESLGLNMQIRATVGATPRVQEFHQILGHLFCGALEQIWEKS